MNSRLTATLLPALLLAGCAVGPDYAPPDPGALPGALPGGDGGGEVRAVFGPEGTGTAEAQAITALWEIAATNNLDILQAVKRIEASRAALAGSRAEYWPSVGFSAGTSKAKNFNPSSSSERSTLGFDASWELDLFGKVRRSVEAAGAELEASEYSLADALASLRAEIAGECVNLALQRRLLEITGKNLDLQRDFEKIAREKFEAGLAPELDWLSAQSQLFATEASLPSLAASATGCVRRIELLCGLTPGTLDNEPELLSFPPLPEWGGFGVPATVPSELLRRRPDVRRAERAYAAALARVGVSQASYYPSLTIGAGFSLASDSFARWGDAVRSISFGPSVSWSILSFGRTKARVAQARAAAEEAAIAYRAAALNAFHEVEDAAVSLAGYEARLPALTAARDAQRRADDLALKMYREDLGEYRDVLTAHQSLLSHERTLDEVRANAILSQITLAKALAVQ